MNYLVIAVLLLPIVIASKETSLPCGACLMIVTEVEKAVRAVDPRKKISVGSFRVDPKGNQNINEIPYARSEVFLTEALEDVCDKYKKYTQAVHPVSGKLTYVHEDLVVQYKRINGKTSKLHDACNDIIDNHEADIMRFMSRESDSSVHEFCHTTIGVCSAVDAIPFPDYKEEKTEDDEANDEL
ncbi:hypothetical protein FO519_000598 [Halicephalobus sp. NKZ332]|nr:hypothetical protein FO519_000598 [Halicephalobus sp. NKZ332]